MWSGVSPISLSWRNFACLSGLAMPSAAGTAGRMRLWMLELEQHETSAINRSQSLTYVALIPGSIPFALSIMPLISRTLAISSVFFDIPSFLVLVGIR
jgi:hypothetical protein